MVDVNILIIDSYVNSSLYEPLRFKKEERKKEESNN